MKKDLNEATFTTMAIYAYNNYRCEGIADIQDDLNRFTYLNKLFSKYNPESSSNERVIMNHLIIIYNVFGASATKFLFFKIKKNYHHLLIPFLLYINKLSEKIEIDNKLVKIDSLKISMELIEKLKMMKYENKNI